MAYARVTGGELCFHAQVALARSHGCLFLECSAKNRSGVAQAFQELVQRILDTPSLLAETAPAQINLRAKSKAGAPGCNC